MLLPLCKSPLWKLVLLPPTAAQVLIQHEPPAATIAGFGFLLALIASSPAVHVIDRMHTPFPPFATLPWAFLGFSTYLVSTDFYLSAIRISQDIGLRKSIRQVASEESSGSRLLDNIGTAQMEQAIQDKVQKIAKEQEESLKQETGVQQ